MRKIMKNRFFEHCQKNNTFDKRLNWIIAAIFLSKIMIAGFFSSGYMNGIFIPFVTEFITHHVDPWQHFYTMQPQIAFPYPPLMLYLLVPGGSILQFTAINTIFWMNIFIKIPIFIADLAILIMLCHFRP